MALAKHRTKKYKQVQKAYHAKKYKIYRDQYRDSALIARYGISIKERDQIFADQGCCCAICKTKEPVGVGWCVDHDHETKKVRGVLCQNCNQLLGHAKDNIYTLYNAIEYLKINQI